MSDIADETRSMLRLMHIMGCSSCREANICGPQKKEEAFKNNGCHDWNPDYKSC